MDHVKLRSAPVKMLNDYVDRQIFETGREALRKEHLSLKKYVNDTITKMKERHLNEETQYDKALLNLIWQMQGCRRFRIQQTGSIFDGSVLAANNIVNQALNIQYPYKKSREPFLYRNLPDSFYSRIHAPLHCLKRFRIFRTLEHKGRLSFRHALLTYDESNNNKGCMSYFQIKGQYPVLGMLPDIMNVYINNIIAGRWCPVNKLFSCETEVLSRFLSEIDDRRRTGDMEKQALYDAVMLYMTTEFVFQLYGEVICTCPDSEPPFYRILILNYLMKIAGGLPLPGKPDFITTWLHNIIEPCLGTEIRKSNGTVVALCRDMELVRKLGSTGDASEASGKAGFDPGGQDALLDAIDTSHKNGKPDFVWSMVLENSMCHVLPDTAKLSRVRRT